MTFHTPVMFSDSADLVALAVARGWAVVTRTGSTLRINRRGSDFPAPPHASTIDSGGLTGESALAWGRVLDWISGLVHRPLLLVQPDEYPTDAALWAARTRGWPIGSAIVSPSPSRTPQSVALLTASAGSVFASAEVRNGFVASCPVLVTELADTPMVDLPGTARAQSAGEAPIRMLIVAYYAGPNPTVGVQRPTYWFENLGTLSGGDIAVEIATATPWPDAPAGVHHIPDLGSAILTDQTGLTQEGQAKVAHRTPYNLHRHVAGYWHLALEEYFSTRSDSFDVVLISGNPFAPMEFSRFAHSRWQATTIHDFRDPFALNPRLAMGDEAREQAVRDEKALNREADVIVVVDPVWGDYLVPGSLDADIRVVGNGYDERVLGPTIPAERGPGPIRLGHAGQFFAQSPPDRLLSAVAARGAHLLHIGAPLADTGGAEVTQPGRMPRELVLSELANVDCGVAYVTKARTEIPTKVFDYLLSGLDILILHQGEPEQSPMWNLLSGVAGIYWVANDVDDIIKFLASYRPARHTDPARHRPFSRAASSAALVSLVADVAEARSPDTARTLATRGETPNTPVLQSLAAENTGPSNP